jgi:tryptophanyl-tRNA synthetase
MVFTYLDAFDEDHIAVEDLKALYIRSGLGDRIVWMTYCGHFSRQSETGRSALARDPGFAASYQAPHYPSA